MNELTLRDNLTPALRTPDTRPLMQALAKAVEVEMRKHWRKTNSDRPNKDGLFRSNFWNRHGYDQTAVIESDDRSALIRIGDAPMRYQLEGGTITPLAGKNGLTIPKTNEAKRTGSARLFSRALQFIPTPGHGGLIGMLIDIPTYGIKVRKDGSRNVKREGTIQYYVVASVTKGADPSILPASSTFDPAFRAICERWLRQNMRTK